MRRSRTTGARAFGLIGLIGLAVSPEIAIGQEFEGPGVLVRPPAEVRPMGVHPAPPAPTVPPPIPSATSPRSGSADTPGGPSLVIDPRASRTLVPSAGRVPERPPFPALRPGLDARPTTAVSTVSEGPPLIQPPLRAAGETWPTAPTLDSVPMVLSPSIAPPLTPADGDGPRANPLLPPGSTADRTAPDAFEIDPDRDRRDRPEGVPDDRGRPNPIGGFFNRIFGRPSDPIPPDRVAGGLGTGLVENDPVAVEAIRTALERRIRARAGDRLSTLEVLIVGRRVHIRAQASRFWLRRPLKRQLEGIPMPSGFLSTIEVR